MKSKTFPIPLVIIIIICLGGLGIAYSPSPCNCSKLKAKAIEVSCHQKTDCCNLPVNASPTACPCGDNCNPAFQAPAKDLIAIFSTANPVSSMNLGRCGSMPCGSFHPEPVISGLDFPIHNPPSGPVTLQTRSLRC